MSPIDEYVENDLYKIVKGDHEYAGQIVEMETFDLDEGTAIVSFTRISDGYRFTEYEITLDSLGAITDPVEYTTEEGGENMSESEKETPTETPAETPAETPEAEEKKEEETPVEGGATEAPASN